MRASIVRLEPFCLADPTFFETPDLLPDDAALFPVANRAAPPGWQRGARGYWVGLRPHDLVLPAAHDAVRGG